MGLLMMMLTIGGLLLAGALFCAGIAFKLSWLRRFVVGAVSIWFVLYFGSLLLVSATSAEVLLRPGEAKAFCGFYIDCHMHIAVESVTRVPEIGGVRAKGEYLLVEVMVSSDAARATIGMHDVRAELILPVGAVGRDMEAEKRLNEDAPPLETSLLPEESFVRALVFDVPEKTKQGRLLVTEGNTADRLVETFLIGDEDSLFHGKRFFEIDVPETNL